jgi:hypothetical protein
MSKYDPIGEFLRSQFGDEIPMTFVEVERVLGFRLPPSAREHRPWWSNNPDNSAMTKVWLKAGFRTERVDLAGEKLVFVRGGAEEETMSPGKKGFSEAAAAASNIAKGTTRHPALGAMKGMLTIMPGVDLTEPADPEWGRIAYGDDE